MPSIALLDRNGFYGSARLNTSARLNDVRAHVGAEVVVSQPGPRLAPPAWLPHQHTPEPARLPLLCHSRGGYQNLCQLITQFKMRETTKEEGAATFDDLGAICLWTCLSDRWRRRAHWLPLLMRGGEEEGRKDSRTVDSHLWSPTMYMSSFKAPGAGTRVAQPCCHSYRAFAEITTAGDERRTVRHAG